MPADLLELIVKTYGIVGLLILAPFVSTVALWRAYAGVAKLLSEQSTTALTIESKRVEDAKARVVDTERMMLKLMELVKEQTALGTETNSTMERLHDSVDKLERHALTNGRSGRGG